MPLDIVAPHIFTKPFFSLPASGILGQPAVFEDLEAENDKACCDFRKMNTEFIHPLSNIAMEDFLPFENSSTGHDGFLTTFLLGGHFSRYSQWKPTKKRGGRRRRRNSVLGFLGWVWGLKKPWPFFGKRFMEHGAHWNHDWFCFWMFIEIHDLLRDWSNAINLQIWRNLTQKSGGGEIDIERSPHVRKVVFFASRINFMAQRNTFLNGEIQIWTIWENRTSDNLTPQMWCLIGGKHRRWPKISNLVSVCLIFVINYAETMQTETGINSYSFRML